jgi:hypothetical protein
MSIYEQEYKQYKEFHESQQRQMFQLVSIGNDYDPLIHNTAVYCFGKHVYTFETQTLPHLILAIERHIAQPHMKPEEMYNYISPQEVEEKAKAHQSETVY